MGGLFFMAPKWSLRWEGVLGEASFGLVGKGKGFLQHKEEKNFALHTQLHAKEATESYKDHMPLAIQLEINKLVRNVWDEVKENPTEELHKEVDDWVIDLGNTVGHAYAYDCMLMQYQVNM